MLWAVPGWPTLPFLLNHSNYNHMHSINLNSLEYSWTALVRLHNSKIVTIWHTAWPSIKQSVSEIISVSSDYPKYIIKPF